MACSRLFNSRPTNTRPRPRLRASATSRLGSALSSTWCTPTMILPSNVTASGVRVTLRTFRRFNNTWLIMHEYAEQLPISGDGALASHPMETSCRIEPHRVATVSLLESLIDKSDHVDTWPSGVPSVCRATDHSDTKSRQVQLAR